MTRYPSGKTQEVTTAFLNAGGSYYRVFSEKRPKGRNGPYQRVKLWGAVDFEKAKAAFEAAGFINVREAGLASSDSFWYFPSPGVTADYPLSKKVKA